MTILRRRKDPRTTEQRLADGAMLGRIERGEALAVSPRALGAAARRIRERNAERRGEVAKLGMAIAELRRTFGLTQEEVARAIGTSKPNISALERGRAPGISLERFMAVIETLRASARGKPRAPGAMSSGELVLSPTSSIASLEECVETA